MQQNHNILLTDPRLELELSCFFKKRVSAAHLVHLVVYLYICPIN